jgi:Flp pilus assembly secretin CpaC
MSFSFALVAKPPTWRRVGSSLALAASLAFACQPSLSLAQVQMSDPDRAPPKVKAPAPAPAKKAVSRHTETDNVSDDLNRRESERTAQAVRAMNASLATPAVMQADSRPVEAKAVEIRSAVDSLPPTVAAIPPRAPIVSASLTPDLGVGQPVPAQPPVAVAPAVERAAPAPQFAQAPTPTPPAPAPAPVPIQPLPSAGPPGPPAVTGGGASGRPFGQSQVVPTEAPTLTLEVNKGTALKLPGPAATVFVAAPDIADVQVRSPNMVYVFAKKPGDTVLYAVDAQDRVLLNTIVRVTSPLSRIKGALDGIHPGNGVIFDNQGETIVLTGSVRSALVAEDARRLALQQVGGKADKVISNIRVDAPTQVQLRVKVAEVKRDALKRVGINWQNINNIALFGTGAILGGFAVNTISATGGPASGALKFQTSDNGLNTFIDFLATQSMATVLAEPNLIAMSGETASFLAGSEIPLIVPQGGTLVGTITVQYKQVGVMLAFTPTIIGDRINLKVAPEVSELSAAGSVSVPLTSTAVVTIPAITTRKASTTIELGSGQSFAIAGLLHRTSLQDIVKFPWLGDVPVLGTLFKSDAYQREETELVIIITPYLVEPTSNKLSTPLTGRVPPTDVDRLVMQRFNHPTPPRRVAVGRETVPAGPTAGFTLE